jgi:hypothetical protein
MLPLSELEGLLRQVSKLHALARDLTSPTTGKAKR